MIWSKDPGFAGRLAAIQLQVNEIRRRLDKKDREEDALLQWKALQKPREAEKVLLMCQCGHTSGKHDIHSRMCMHPACTCRYFFKDVEPIMDKSRGFWPCPPRYMRCSLCGKLHDGCGG